ncbi:IS91 family transposase [Stieleria varia]
MRVGAASMVDASTCGQVQSVLAKLSLCRTHVLGGREYLCNDCGKSSSRYNSCGDRHCPQCSGSKRVDFNDKASKLILSGVAYYQVVFTLPSDLSELALANRNELADLLVSTAWKSLSKNIKSEQDYDPAAISVLHTWNQKLEAHWHVHMLVPGAGPSLSGDEWKEAKTPPGVRNSDGYYLVDSEKLKDDFRKRAVAKLRRLRRDGKLKFGGKFEYLQSDENWEVFVKNLESTQWVAYIQPPPKETSGGGEVVNYLTRYLTGGPISNHRITAADGDEVVFMAREGKRVGGEREQVPIKLSVPEFTRRWCLHIQPDQLTKSRYFGGWSNNRLAGYMARCQELLGTEPEVSEAPVEAVDSMDSQWEPPSLPECAHCGSIELSLVCETPKPTWKELFWRESETCPEWYAERQRESHREFWTAHYGSDYYDWYLETQVEVAKETGPEPAKAIQMYLPGLTPGVSFEIESF